MVHAEVSTEVRLRVLDVPRARRQVGVLCAYTCSLHEPFVYPSQTRGLYLRRTGLASFAEAHEEYRFSQDQLCGKPAEGNWDHGSPQTATGLCKVVR